MCGTSFWRKNLDTICCKSVVVSSKSLTTNQVICILCILEGLFKLREPFSDCGNQFENSSSSAEDAALLLLLS